MIRTAITIAITESAKGGPYDLDGWWLLDSGHGWHTIGFDLGDGFMIYSLKAADRDLRNWTLTLEDCAVAHMDTEEYGSHLTFDCPEVSLPVPEKGPLLRFLDGPMRGEARVVGAKLSASTSPFGFGLGLEVCGGSSTACLHLDATGAWRLIDRDAEGFPPTVRFSAKFSVGGRRAEPWWRPI